MLGTPPSDGAIVACFSNHHQLDGHGQHQQLHPASSAQHDEEEEESGVELTFPEEADADASLANSFWLILVKEEGGEHSNG